MKIKELITETPYKHDGEMNVPDFGSTFISDKSLQRTHTKLTGIVIEGQDVSYYELNTPARKKIIAVIKKDKPDGEHSNQIIFALDFKVKNTLVKIPDEFSGRDIMQIDRAATAAEFRNRGIASFIYATLVKNKFIVLSDISQFEDGSQLWKKMAKKAAVNNYKVYILDAEYGFEKGADGQPLQYDSTNIDDVKIWSNGVDLSKEHVLLVMK